MLSLKEKDRPIVRKLFDAGCCARCVLRFCCVGTYSSYRQPYEDIHRELFAFIGEENSKSHDASDQGQSEDPPSKRMKIEDNGSLEDSVTPAEPKTVSDICPVCLGVLQHFCDHTYAKQVSDAVKKEQYEFDRLVLTVSLPAQLSVREHSCWLHIKREVREKSMCLGKDDVIQVKDAFKWAVQGKIGQDLGANVLANSAFEVSVGFTHPETDEDCHFLATICPDCFKPTKNKLEPFKLEVPPCFQQGASIFTRMAVVKALEKISDEKFSRHYPCPPKKPETTCTALDTTCLHNSVFIAGRYNKFSRELPQTPWVIDGERRMEGSVEELIAAPLLFSFRADGFNFSSSGREDVDVRTLGNGRPFTMELLNPHRAKFNTTEIRQLQETINQSSDKIRVRDLQIVTREATSRMKEGEEEKTKSYSALIWTHKVISSTDLEFLGNIKDLKIAQKTPLRVLHRRPLAVRQRLIHSMSVSYLDTHHFTLKLCTQAGTYIKEFVHGDFGRTKPNLCDLMKTDADILELDVESVDIDWPPAIPD
ncbi:putative tRNA pseudouridine synthase Pus10 isoform X1 [Myxocyprinus asiaticus]|uniref:putative tRNA pseudouridine synthase Pus10 isoform X1 n=1 Tax=Myxocyprinus asiaticus TaxID=70543 RepID=UPI002222F9E5|nr:putative tRNA pseudouridine synthase Pus10 isoform X1 [Myxocyprinus asiaticus]XP_051559940.1 putative tRNA pseudouridine synthase Pus10 isoform X1 [Myxocyprinus asiaticus]